MIREHHQSSVQMFLRCGEQARRRYVEGEIIPPGIAVARGTGIHSANKLNLGQKIATGVDLPEEDLCDAARDSYVNTLKDGVYLTKEEQPSKRQLLNDGLNDTIRGTKLYRNKVAPVIVPRKVEFNFGPFLLSGLEMPLAGTIDYLRDNSGVPRIGDIKTTSRKWSEDRVKSEIQPVFYSLAIEYETDEHPEWEYNILVLSKNEDVQAVDRVVGRRDYKSLFAMLQVVEKMIKTGTFPPANPTSWWCGESWCGYWNTCKYVGN